MTQTWGPQASSKAKAKRETKAKVSGPTVPTVPVETALRLSFMWVAALHPIKPNIMVILV